MAIRSSVEGQAQPLPLYPHPRWDPESLLKAHLGEEGGTNCLGQTKDGRQCQRRIGQSTVQLVSLTLKFLSHLEPATAAAMPDLEGAVRSLLCHSHVHQAEPVERLRKALRSSQCAADPAAPRQWAPSGTDELQRQVGDLRARLEGAEAAAKLYETQCSQLRREKAASEAAQAQAEQQQAQVVEAQRRQLRSQRAELEAARRRVKELEARLEACRAGRGMDRRDAAEARNAGAEAAQADASDAADAADAADDGAPDKDGADAKAAEAGESTGGSTGRRMRQTTPHGGRPGGKPGRSLAVDDALEWAESVRAYRDEWMKIDTKSPKVSRRRLGFVDGHADRILAQLLRHTLAGTDP
jgi:hypothetical protein